MLLQCNYDVDPGNTFSHNIQYAKTAIPAYKPQIFSEEIIVFFLPLSENYEDTMHILNILNLTLLFFLLKTTHNFVFKMSNKQFSKVNRRNFTDSPI